MSILDKRFLLMSTGNPNHVGAATLPYNDTITIKDKLDLLEFGLQKPSPVKPSAVYLELGEMVFWYNAGAKKIQVIHKDDTGRVREGTVSSLK